MNRGILYSNQQKWDLALSDYNQAIKFNPQEAQAYNNRSVIYTLRKQFQKALADAEKAAEFYLQEGNEAKFQNAQKLLKIIRQEMNKN
ncbi:TPR domain protein [Crocosphaera watsonii WH 0402]|uniref:TPR domain protein n=1 Tax=Crocosphaera watsonii WH 0402 TaxID=1284629 RepID=T2JM14_CROWT|nr:TPR domain protein [Crocosphaera watsonii WH 0402]